MNLSGARLLALPLVSALLVSCTTPAANPTPSPKPDTKPGNSAQLQPSPSAGVAASPSALPAPSAEAAGRSGEDRTRDVSLRSADRFTDFERGGNRNVVRVDNKRDGRFEARGKADLVRVRGDDVTPANIAEAQSKCTDCQAIAVAIQVVLYRRGANVVAPVNRAVAVNEDCTGCYTVARALQFVIPVDDPREVPRDVDALIRDIDQEMNYFERIKDVQNVDPQEAQRRLDSLLARYGGLVQYLNDLVDTQTASTAGTPLPSPEATPSPSASASPTRMATGTALVVATPSPRATGTVAVATPSPSVTSAPAATLAPATMAPVTTPAP